MDIENFAPTPFSFGRRGVLVTPSDTTDLPKPVKAVVVVGAGDVAIIPTLNSDEESILFEGCEMGFVPPYQVPRVLATGTTATVYTAED